jgi:NADH:ubiquinone oxidoreductase subunit 5 (subunit L)/multisubunit Na+/H+ antiporter MnhA subunit
MYHLGGLWRKLPFTTMVAVLAALGIAGFPGLNGFASKTLLHHTLVLAAEHGHPSLLLAEKIFVLTGAGTVASMLKLICYSYLGKAHRYKEVDTKEPWPTIIAMGALALSLIVIGIKPQLLLDKLIVPTLSIFPYSWNSIEHELLHINFWNLGNIIDMAICLALGWGLFHFGSRTGLFHLHLPPWVSIHHFGATAFKILLCGGQTVWSYGSAGQQLFNHQEKLLQKELRLILHRIDSRPGNSPLYNQICISNMSFDTLIIVLLLAFILFLYTPSNILAGGM